MNATNVYHQTVNKIYEFVKESFFELFMGLQFLASVHVG